MIQRYIFNPLEPANSYEVCYVMLVFRDKHYGLSYDYLRKILGSDRIKELDNWSKDNLTSRWEYDHCNYKPYRRIIRDERN